jgi:hypothetical protein
MPGYAPNGYDLSELPQAPVWPTNIGHFDPQQVMQTQSMGLQLANQLNNNPLTQQATTTGLQTQIGGNQLVSSEQARQLAFAKAQEANAHQDAANYAGMQSNQYSRIAASGSPAAFTPYSQMMGGAGQPSTDMGLPSLNIPQAPSSALPEGSSPSVPIAQPGGSQPSVSQPSPSQGESTSTPAPPPAGVLSGAGSPGSMQSSGGGAVNPGSPLATAAPMASPMGGFGSGSPLMGGVMTIPGANGQLQVAAVQPSPLLGKFTMGVHAIQVGTDANGLPLYQNIEETALGARPYGKPFTMTSQNGGVGPTAIPGEGTQAGTAAPLPPGDLTKIQQTYGTQESPQMMQARLMVPAHQKLITEANDDALTFNKAQQNIDILTKAVYRNNGLMPDPAGKVDAQGNPVMIPDPNAKPIASGPIGGSKFNLNALSGTNAGLALRGMMGDSSGSDLASARSSLVGDVMSNVHNIRNINEYKGVTAVLPEPTQPPQTQLQNVWNAQKKLDNVIARNDVYRNALSAGMADGDANDYANKKTSGIWNQSAAISGGGGGGGGSQGGFVTGQTYKDAQGNQATWTGTSWQPMQ